MSALDTDLAQYIFNQIKEFTEEQRTQAVVDLTESAFKLDKLKEKSLADSCEIGASCICLVGSLIEGFVPS